MIWILSFIEGLFLLKHFRLYSTIFFLSIGLICGCSYEPLAPPEMPTYYQTINLPLADVSLPLADLVNPDNNIYGDSTKDQLYFQFSGNLDTVTLTENIFQIPAVGNVNFSQNFSELSESQLTFSRSVTQATKLSEIITIPGILPSPNDLLIGEIARYELDGQRYKYRVFDKDDIPYFERVDYLTVGSGTFQTEIDNQLPVDMDSVRITLRNKNGSLIAESFYENVPAGATLSDGTPGNLNGAQLFDSIEVIVTAVMAGSQGQPVTIPANTDPFIAIKFDTNIEEIESFTGIPKPIVTTQNQLLPPSNNTIFKATIAQTTTSPLDTNFLDLTIHNLMPFNLRMQVIFHNFYIRNEPLTIDTIVQSGQIVENPARLDGYIFRNPDSTTVVDSFLVEIIATILPNAGEQVVTIPTDMGDASIDVNLYFARLKLDMLEGFFNESFDIPPMAIANIPTGLANVDFGQVFLKLTFFNEIQARTNVSLVLRGLKKGVAPQTITEDGSIAKASPANPIQESMMEIDIAPIFNMVPDSILVSGQAIIPSDDTSRLQIGKAFWGFYEITVPFQVKIGPVTFIPVNSTEMAAIDPETRQKIRDGLIKSSIYTEIINDFPFSGNLSILMSNYDYFPLEPDSLDAGYFWLNDTLYARTDTGDVPIIIDTLLLVELPPPEAFNSNGSVKTPGFTLAETPLDSAKMEAILRDETHYIRPRVHFNATEDFVIVGYYDEVRILAAISLTVETMELINNNNENETPATVP
ncbi:MAG: hypothetical protein KA076_02795 [Candidatus Marinimicrobia bacterium]|nr:hypothetical protein [Candidatus Neomarinimicrobiota bacterium]